MENINELFTEVDTVIVPTARAITFSNHRILEKKIITNLVGAGVKNSTELKAILTVDLPVGYSVAWRESSTGSFCFYELAAGTGDSGDDEDSPNILKPNDYNASTNAKVWKLASIETISINTETLRFNRDLFTSGLIRFKGQINIVEIFADTTNETGTISYEYKKSTQSSFTPITPATATGINTIISGFSPTDIWDLNVITEGLSNDYAIIIKYIHG